jgi:hypothetical protein
MDAVGLTISPWVVLAGSVLATAAMVRTLAPSHLRTLAPPHPRTLAP